MSGLQLFCQFWKRQAPTNDEDPSNKIFKILNMGPISIKKHEWMLANMVPISISKHKMTFIGILIVFYNSGIIFLGPKRLAYHKVFLRKRV